MGAGGEAEFEKPVSPERGWFDQTLHSPRLTPKPLPPFHHCSGIIIPPGRCVHVFMFMLLGCSG